MGSPSQPVPALGRFASAINANTGEPIQHTQIASIAFAKKLKKLQFLSSGCLHEDFIRRGFPLVCSATTKVTFQVSKILHIMA
jgi:hypothetical protein